MFFLAGFSHLQPFPFRPVSDFFSKAIFFSTEFFLFAHFLSTFERVSHCPKRSRNSTENCRNFSFNILLQFQKYIWILWYSAAQPKKASGFTYTATIWVITENYLCILYFLKSPNTWKLSADPKVWNSLSRNEKSWILIAQHWHQQRLGKL